MEKYFEMLKKCPLFENIRESDIQRFLSCLGARVKFFDRKCTVMNEGTPAKNIGVVLSGEVHTVQIDYFGNRNIISVSQPSEMFSEAFACAELDSIPVSIVAEEPSEIMMLDCRHLVHTCEKTCAFHQQIIYNLMKSLADSNVTFYQRMEVTSKRSTREKLMAYLILQSKKCGKNSFDIPFDRQELADYLEVERSGLSAEISKMKKDGLIDARKNHFKII